MSIGPALWSWKTFFKYVGPGFIIAIAYLDPGNLEADLQAYCKAMEHSLSLSRRGL